MKIKNLDDFNDATALYGFIQKNLIELNYVPYENLEHFNENVVKNKNIMKNSSFVLMDNNQVLGICISFLYEGNGYIPYIIIDKEFRRRHFGSELLRVVVDSLRKKEVQSIYISHKCPLKIPWYIEKEKNIQHNKSPGVKFESAGYFFFRRNGFQVDSFEISYYLDLKSFVFPTKIKEIEKDLSLKGYTIEYFNSEKHIGYNEMFDRLNDNSYKDKFKNGIENNLSMFIALKNKRYVCGCVGHLYREKSGRGFFQGIAVDPNHSGNKLGTLLFYKLCDELKKMNCNYMTLFVSEDNFAKHIYEKAGFTSVEKWAILKLEI